MIKGRERILSNFSILSQLVLTILSFGIAQFWFNTEYTIPQNFVFFAQIIILWGFLLQKLNLGYVFRTEPITKVIRKYFIIISISALLLSVEFFALQAKPFSYFFILAFTFINLSILLLFRYIFIGIMQTIRRKGFNSRNMLIIASNKSETFIQDLLDQKDWGYRIWGIWDESGELKTNFPELNFVDINTDFKTLVDNEAIDEIVYCKSVINQDEISEIRKICQEVGVVFHINTSIAGNLKSNKKFITYRNTPGQYFQLKLKALFDFYFSLLVLFFFSPTFLIIGLIIKLQDGGPIFFRQERVGQNGRRFNCYKFRTMVVNAEALKANLAGMNEQEGPVFKIKSDPRVTKFGKFLRETSIDELPQFINVLKGEMSIVGPRPPVPSEVKEYKRWQLRRLSVKPGITCIWQVSGRNDIKFEEWMKLDMKYIDTWSFWGDIKLIFRTVGVVFGKTGS